MERSGQPLGSDPAGACPFPENPLEGILVYLTLPHWLDQDCVPRDPRWANEVLSWEIGSKLLFGGR